MAKTYFEVNPKSWLLLPADNREWGCLPRASKFGEWSPAAADHIKIIPRQERLRMIKEREDRNLTMRDVIPVIFDQNGKGSCAGESSVGSLVTARSFAGLDYVLLNPWSLYYFSGGGRDGGSNIDTNLQYLRDQGVLPMSVWPRSKGLRRPPKDLMEEHAVKYRVDEFYDIRNAEEFKSALALGFTVVCGRRGHSMYWFEMLDDDRGRVANSWGQWGDKGCTIERVSRDVNWNYGAWATRTARVS